MNIVEQTYWDSSYQNLALKEVAEDDPIRLWINSNVKFVDNLKCLEVGCYPGRFLPVFGKLGYELNGIDLTPSLDANFKDWLHKNNYKTGFFKQTDVLSFSANNEFDLVCSFGFIEHFTDWQHVLDKHLQFLKKDGLLLIVVPNFRSALQWTLHRILDNENLKRHIIDSMNLKDWKKWAIKNKLEIQSLEPIGAFDFWVDIQQRNIIQRQIIKFIELSKGKIASILGLGKMTSPYYGMILKKT